LLQSILGSQFVKDLVDNAHYKINAIFSNISHRDHFNLDCGMGLCGTGFEYDISSQKALFCMQHAAASACT